MALSVCNPIATDAKGRELIQHGTALFPVACYHDDLHQFEVAWQACVSEEEGFEFRARDLLSRLILLLFQNRPVAQKKPSEKDLRDGERTKAMLQYIQAHFSEEITLAQIAGSANISKSECLRCFRSVIVSSPMQYVKQLRIQRAAELLRSTDWKISDIGMQCGFQEMSYFAKTFREMKGCTPKGYREQK